MKNLMLCLLAVIVGLVVTTTARAVPPAPHNNPGQRNAHALFAKWDLDNDGILDASELAKAFRGPNAKPLSGKPSLNDQHADHAFLARYDTNKDGKIDRAEFEKYEQTFISSNKKHRGNYSRSHRPNSHSGVRAHRPQIRR